MLTDGLDDLEPRSFASGGFADTYRATYKGQPAVAKAFKVTFVNDLENMHKRFAKEVVGWKWLRHENILPFVGVTSKPPPFSIVSAWMENGNITNFVKANPDQNPFPLLVDVTHGLRYLHKHDFVHGDLKGANVLINSECRACLADFGLAAIKEDASSFEELSDDNPGGTIRWMAPEMLYPEKYGYIKRSRRKLPSKSTDIYALGMTILEVITGRKPFEHIRPDAALIPKILHGTRPDRPIVGFSDELWMLLDQMWLEEFESTDSPSVRPNTTSILESLQDEAEIWCPMGEKLAAPSEQIKRRVSTASTSDSSGSVGASVDDLLAQLDRLISPEPTDDRLDVQGASTFGGQTSSILSPIGEPVAQEVQLELIRSARLLPPSSHPVLPRPKKQGAVSKAWDQQLKNPFTRKPERGGRAPPNVSDNLAPESDDEFKRHDVLFLKSPKPTITKK